MPRFIFNKVFFTKIVGAAWDIDTSVRGIFHQKFVIVMCHLMVIWIERFSIPIKNCLAIITGSVREKNEYHLFYFGIISEPGISSWSGLFWALYTYN